MMDGTWQSANRVNTRTILGRWMMVSLVGTTTAEMLGAVRPKFELRGMGPLKAH